MYSAKLGKPSFKSIENVALIDPAEAACEQEYNALIQYWINLQTDEAKRCIEELLYAYSVSQSYCDAIYTIKEKTKCYIELKKEPIWWYHPDHLGSSSYLTDYSGLPSHYYNYLPFGEEMVSQNTSSYNNVYRFSGKELDEETGLSYFGARYYNPKWSIWLGVDQKFDKYPNYSPYNYCLQNPVNAVDPDGKDVILLIWASHDGKIGHAGIAVSNYKTEYYKVKINGKIVTKSRQVEDGTYTYRDLWPGGDGAGKKNFDKDVPAHYGNGVYTLDQLKNFDVSGSEGYAADGVIKLDTDSSSDYYTDWALDKYEVTNTKYNGLTNNCSDFAEEGVEMVAGKQLNVNEKLTEKVSATTPNKLYKAAKALPNATVIKDPGKKVNQGFIEAVAKGNEDKARKKID